MKRICLALAGLVACSGPNERVEKLENKMEMQIGKSQRLEDDGQKLDSRITTEVENLRKELKGLQLQVDRLRIEAATSRRTSGLSGGPSDDIEAEKAAQEELEYLRRTPGKAEVVANAIQRLRPITATVVPLLVIELRQAMSRAELELVKALERVLQGLEPEVVVRGLAPELETALTRSIVAGILGEIGHTSARAPLAKHIESPDFKFRFSVAEALAKLGGVEGRKVIPVLIEGLEPKHRDRNILAYDLLHRLTGFSFGYRTFASDEEKAASAARWREWWQTHGDAFEFPAQGVPKTPDKG